MKALITMQLTHILYQIYWQGLTMNRCESHQQFFFSESWSLYWHCMYSVHCTNTNAFFTLVQKSSSFSLQKYTYLTTKSCISLKNYFLQFMFNHYSSTVHRYSHDNCAKIKHNNMKIVEKLQKSHFYIVRGPNKWFP